MIKSCSFFIKITSAYFIFFKWISTFLMSRLQYPRLRIAIQAIIPLKSLLIDKQTQLSQSHTLKRQRITHGEQIPSRYWSAFTHNQKQLLQNLFKFKYGLYPVVIHQAILLLLVSLTKCQGDKCANLIMRLDSPSHGYDSHPSNVS